MKTIAAVAAGLLLSASLCLAQQSPPAEGVGLGNNGASTNSNTSTIPVTSPNQNSTVTDTTGTESGNKQPSAYGGAPEANTATRTRSQGTGGASEAASSTSTRRQPFGKNQATQKAGPAQKGNAGTDKNQQETNQQK